MNHRCLSCANVMLPVSQRHECTNRACHSVFEEHLAPGAMPRDDGLVLTKTDIKHVILALTHLNRPASARDSNVPATTHGRNISSALRKLKAYQKALEEPVELAEVSEGELQRMDIVARMKSGEITQGEAERLLAELAEQEEE